MNPICNSVIFSGPMLVLQELAQQIESAAQPYEFGRLHHLGEMFFPIPPEAGEGEKVFMRNEYQSQLVVDALELERPAEDIGNAEARLVLRCETNGFAMTLFLQRLSASRGLHITYDWYDECFHTYDWHIIINTGMVQEVRETLNPHYLSSVKDYEGDMGPLLPVYTSTAET
jgi:hypothetical protein